MWSPIKVLRYLYLLAERNFIQFDQVIQNEKNPSLKYYFLFQKNFLLRKYESCFENLVTALMNNCAHWNTINIFTKSCLPLLLKEEKYSIVESMAESMLTYSSFNQDIRLSVYHALGNSLYFQNRNEKLKEMVDRIELIEKQKDDYFVKWYRKGMADSILSIEPTE